jgi:hypothetical protein
MKYLIFLGIVLLILVAISCTRTDEGAKNVQWIQLANIHDECSDGTGLESGCYRWSGDVCYVWTKKAQGPTDKQVMLALGHEVRHCFEGNFHIAGDY